MLATVGQAKSKDASSASPPQLLMSGSPAKSTAEFSKALMHSSRLLCVVFCPLHRMDDQLAQLASKRLNIADELKRVMRELRKRRKENASIWALPPHACDAILAIYILSGYNMDAAGKYLHDLGASRGWPAKEQLQLRQIVEDLFLASDSDKLASLTNVEEPSQPRILQTAMQYVREWKVFCWTRALNLDRGIAPSTSMLVRQAMVEGVQPCAARAPIRPCARIPHWARKWARRWRKRWNARIGKIQAREMVSLEEARAKATIFLSSASDVFNMLSAFWGPTSGPPGGPKSGPSKSWRCVRVIVGSECRG